MFKDEETKKEYHRFYQRKWYLAHRVEILKKTKDRDAKNRKAHTERTERHRKAYPEKHHARYELTKAILRGDVIKQPCEKCGEKLAYGHHDDYSKPFVVRWLCRTHHGEEHRKINTAKDKLSILEGK